MGKLFLSGSSSLHLVPFVFSVRSFCKWFDVYHVFVTEIHVCEGHSNFYDQAGC